MEARARKRPKKGSSIPVAVHMKRIALKVDEKLAGASTVSYAGQSYTGYYQSSLFDTPSTPPSLLAFIWPSPIWMVGITLETSGLHTFVKFTNLHFLKTTFYHEIGIDQSWLHVSDSDNTGEFILCASSERVHKFSLPLKQKLNEPGKIVSTIFTPKKILGIAWNESQCGCYALLNDGKTLLHVDFGGPEGFEEVAKFKEEVAVSRNTHFFHVNEEGSMAICDHKKNAVYFFEKIGSKPTVLVRAPSDMQGAMPVCVNTRRGEEQWYVMWASLVSLSMKLYVYDSSFQLLGLVLNLYSNRQSMNSKVMFCFQGDYIAVAIDCTVEVYGLS